MPKRKEPLPMLTVTPEMLRMKIRSLPYDGEETVGDVMERAVVVWEELLEQGDECFRVSDKLRAIGIYIDLPTEEGDPPLEFHVEYHQRLVKAYPEMGRYDPEMLEGLVIRRAGHNAF